MSTKHKVYMEWQKTQNSQLIIEKEEQSWRIFTTRHQDLLKATVSTPCSILESINKQISRRE